MSVNVDFKGRRLSASVSDLIEAPRDGTRAIAVLDRLRAELGRTIHDRYRRERERGLANFTAEVSVELRREVDGFEVVVRGRVDGLVDDGAGLIVEEVKSVTMTGAELDRVTAAAVPDYCLQAQLYGLALAHADPGRAISIHLIMVSVLDRCERTLEIDFDAGAVARALDRRVRALLGEARARQRRRRERAGYAAALRFPYPAARPHQQELIDAMEAALAAGRPLVAMAPTGVGKTVSALLAGLRFALRGDARLFFVTAKTTQQTLVARTFADLCTAARVDARAMTAITLRAKERMCPSGELLCHPELCPYLRDYATRVAAGAVVEDLLASATHVDADTICSRGEALRLCPFELSLELVEHAEVVICDYNYVYDQGLAAGDDGEELGARPAVVIIDEAHNLFDRAREYYSPFIARASVADVVRRLATGYYQAPVARGSQLCLDVGAGRGDERLFVELGDLCAELSALIDTTGELARSDGARFVDGCAAVELDRSRWAELAGQAARLYVRYALYNRLHRLVHPRDPLTELLRGVLLLQGLIAAREDELIAFAACADHARGAGLGIVCVNPARRLARHHAAMRGTIAMSATLAPLDYYRDVLGFAALDALAVTMPSAFADDHRHVVIVPTVSTTYRERDHYYGDIARLIASIVEAHPGRYVAYFSSFAFLSNVKERLTLAPARLLVQSPDMNESMRRKTLAKLATGAPPRLLLAVSGGIFAEGIDLPGDALIGAIVVGPSLPQPSFARMLMRGYFDARDRRGFDYAMLYPGMQRVVQSAGRVIRTPDDRGVIALLGRRFAEPTYAECLPADWYVSDVRELVARDPLIGLQRFWSQVAPGGNSSASQPDLDCPPSP